VIHVFDKVCLTEEYVEVSCKGYVACGLWSAILYVIPFNAFISLLIKRTHEYLFLYGGFVN
jgi:hypothetical protein